MNMRLPCFWKRYESHHSQMSSAMQIALPSICSTGSCMTLPSAKIADCVSGRQQETTHVRCSEISCESIARRKQETCFMCVLSNFFVFLKRSTLASRRGTRVRKDETWQEEETLCFRVISGWLLGHFRMVSVWVPGYFRVITERLRFASATVRVTDTPPCGPMSRKRSRVVPVLVPACFPFSFPSASRVLPVFVCYDIPTRSSASVSNATRGGGAVLIEQQSKKGMQ